MTYENTLFDFIATMGHLRILLLDGPQKFERYNDLIEQLVFLTNFLRQTGPKDLYAIMNAMKPWENEFRATFAEATYKYELLATQRYLENTIQFDDFVKERYKLLINYEYALIKKHMGTIPKKYLFVGSGPFPASAILMSMLMKDTQFYLLDKSPEACEISTKILDKSHFSDNIAVLPPTSIEDYKDASSYDLVHFATMVGVSEREKAAIYRASAQHISAKQWVLTRTSTTHSFAHFLYAPLPEERLADLYNVAEFQMHTEPVIVSSILLSRKA